MSSVQRWEFEQWAIPRMSELLPLNESELGQIVAHSLELPETESAEHLRGLLGDSDKALRFTGEFSEKRAAMEKGELTQMMGSDEKRKSTTKAGLPPAYPAKNADEQVDGTAAKTNGYAPPAYPPPTSRPNRHHTNAVIEAGKVRAKDEQEMQQMLQNLQFRYQIYNSDIEPEHETDFYCSCPIHQYKAAKYRRYPIQEMWSKAVMYPGERSYDDSSTNGISGTSTSGIVTMFSRNPYQFRVNSPYGYGRQWAQWGPSRPVPSWHARAIHQTINLNNSLNKEAQQKIDAQEPQHSIWAEDPLEKALSNMSVSDRKQPVSDEKKPPQDAKVSAEMPPSLQPSASGASGQPKSSRMASFRKSMGIKSSEERAVSKAHKAVSHGQSLQQQILDEEQGRWPDEQWRWLVANYQEKVGMTRMIADLRARKPTQYLHLLRAGYFEPIPVAWANQASNPLKFSIEAAAGWRGITPAWRGYEDTAEERLYWVLNHREGSVGMRMKPDFISELNMARDRMAKAVEPPPLYFAADDTCHVQHTSEGYSKQVMPAPFRAFDRPEVPTDDTMVLLDTSGSMDFDPVRPMYDQYLIHGYAPSTQPKNKDVAKAIVRRFSDAMANHDHTSSGYDLVTFANSAKHIGTINHANLDRMWRNVRFGGGTRVMTGWQKVKELHFQKHSESATHHPIYGWQAGPETPMLRLLLLLDGEATDMDEFELDLLGLSWAHVTIFLIGVDGCPHHHRHANELQRISDVNHHVSFVDAQGNCPERYVTHELLKRHLGYDVTMREFEEMEQLPAYSEI